MRKDTVSKKIGLNILFRDDLNEMSSPILREKGENKNDVIFFF